MTHSVINAGGRSGRRFLFLQGVPGPFMHQLGQALASRGHGVLRVNFNGGDRADWPSLPAVDFCGHIRDWPDCLQGLVDRYDPTDIVLHGDCRPVHRAAMAIAERDGSTPHVFEEGYLRPNWVTLEIGGVNGYSRLPTLASVYREAAPLLPPFDPPPHVPPSVRARARGCLRYGFASQIRRGRFPHYETHRGWSPWHEGLGWLRRMAGDPLARRRGSRALAQTLSAPNGFYVLPIQMDNDSQILHHSDLGGMTRAIQLVVASFARHAPPGTMLAVKAHPLDNGVINWSRVTRDAATTARVNDRVTFIEACDLQHLLDHTRGMVTVNSTSATFALTDGVPVMALGKAVYKLRGLTHQGPLDTFWTAPCRPDPWLVNAFCRVLAHACLVRGDFFTPDGIQAAVAGSVPRIEERMDASERIAAMASQLVIAA
jgi:capsular polysaccharide export protein